jgi:hypothetical protein
LAIVGALASVERTGKGNFLPARCDLSRIWCTRSRYCHQSTPRGSQIEESQGARRNLIRAAVQGNRSSTPWNHGRIRGGNWKRCWGNPWGWSGAKW